MFSFRELDERIKCELCVCDVFCVIFIASYSDNLSCFVSLMLSGELRKRTLIGKADCFVGITDKCSEDAYNLANCFATTTEKKKNYLFYLYVQSLH